MICTTIRAPALRGYPHGMPHRWNYRQWKNAFSYFRDYYGRKGIFRKFFARQPAVTMPEFQRAVLADFGDAMSDKAEGWQWASIERERVRDRILVARGREPIDQ